MLLHASIMSGQENIKSGIIQFTSYESNSKSVIKWSSGQAYNGVRDIKIAFSENMSCRQDMSLKTRTIFCPEENTIKIVFDELQRVLLFDYSCEPLMNTYSNSRWEYTINKTDDTKEILGFNCRRWDISFVGQSNNDLSIEAWVYEDATVPDIYWTSALYGLKLPGIFLKYTVNQNSYAPFVGDLSSYMAAEAKSVDFENNEADIFSIPADYETYDFRSEGMLGFGKAHKHYKANSKALKKAKKFPTNNIDESVRFDVDEDWDF